MVDTYVSKEPLAARVYVDGSLVADSAASFDSGATTVLEGLEVTWGRSTVIDQPGPGTCTLEVAQRGGGASFLSRIAAGRPIRVEGHGVRYWRETREGWGSPGFNTIPPWTDYPVLGPVSYSWIDPNTGRPNPDGSHQSLAMIPTDPSEPLEIMVPPDVFTDSPTGWQRLPQTVPGTTWHIHLWVMLQPGARAWIRPAIFPSPTGAGAYVLGAESLPVIGPPGPEWVEVDVEFAAPATNGGYVGVALSIGSAGPMWTELDGSWIDQGTYSWDDLGNRGTVGEYVWVDEVTVTAPDAALPTDVQTFEGRITDVEAERRGKLAGGTTVVTITARDYPADLANQRVGDEPWAVEPVAARARRVLALAGDPVGFRIDPSLERYAVTYRDVDSQDPAGLLEELAESVGGVLWPAWATLTGPYYWLEDPATRVPLRVLQEQPDGTVTVQPAVAAQTALHLSSGSIQADPVRFVQSVSDVATRVNMTWLEQGVDEDGKPETTDRHETIQDPDAEAELGQRGLSVSTQLTNAPDAQRVGAALLARASDRAWRVESLEWDVALSETFTEDDMGAALELLDATIRAGRPLLVQGMPDWSPSGPVLGVYVEGGTYTYQGGRWRFQLTVSQPTGMGRGVSWRDLDPEWSWSDFQRSVSWGDMYAAGRNTNTTN